MLQNQFRSVCRLNRIVVICSTLFGLMALWPFNTPWAMTMGLVMVGVQLAFLMGCELMLKMSTRLREAESQTVQHVSLFLPLLYGAYTLTIYGLTGSAMVLALGFLGWTEARLLVQKRLVLWMAGAYLAAYAIGLPFGYPKAIGLHPWEIPVSLFCLALCWFAISRVVGNLVFAYDHQVDKLQSMAATDVLTGLTNRRQFNNRLNQEIARARRHGTPLSLALFDLDDFKRLNDFYGHPVGDRILKELGKLIRNNLRESDIPARYGGEEFVLILPETKEAEAADLLERMRILVSQTVFCLPDNPLTITVSVGVAQLEPRQQTTFELVDTADKALYQAKNHGKNQVMRGSQLSPTVLLSKKIGL